ncbi:hypothetical protein [Fusobacterium sp. PH5-44]|uniref:hypothetical protein n=1 Tax=unclassified Fusobacterium TaxID=2648384 RepID=UPI003D1A6A74
MKIEYIYIPWGKVDEHIENDYSNVYCYNEIGEKLWQIEKREKPVKTFFVGLSHVNKELFAVDFSGLACILNKDTGKIIGRRVVK